MTPPFSPAWWAAWTFLLHRPGRLDDEEVPEALRDAASPVWWHYPPWTDASGRRDRESPAWGERRARVVVDWPTMLRAQLDRSPLPTDGCRLHGGGCSGACDEDVGWTP